VIDEQGKQLGVMSPREGLQIARQQGLDLVEVVPNADPPVCKVIDFGKYKYELSKKEKMQRKRHHLTQLKEVRFHPNTDVHDFDFKARHARQFIADGHKVKATVIFKGREMAYQDHGKELLERLAVKLDDVAKIDQPAHMEGRYMIMYFVPDRSKKKGSPRAEVKASQGEVEKE